MIHTSTAAGAMEESYCTPLGAREVSRNVFFVLESVQLDKIQPEHFPVLGKDGGGLEHGLHMDSADSHGSSARYAFLARDVENKGERKEQVKEGKDKCFFSRFAIRLMRILQA